MLKKTWKLTGQRILSGLLCALMLVALLPTVSLPSLAADWAPATEKPMLVVTGGRDGLNVGHALAETYRVRFPKARVVEYPESGHSPFAEAAERFNADLEAFVSETRTAPRPAD